MPAINVARTDTFEQQRVKINEISTALFNVTSGGSDLSTGNLKLGDGTISGPSLGFVNDTSLGIYRPGSSTIGFVSNGKKIADVALTKITSFQDIFVQQRKLLQTGLTLVSEGQNYDEGSYLGINILGGSGQYGTLDITVVAWNAEITNAGSGYNSGSFVSVPLTGGAGAGATASFTVDPIAGDITNAGSAYVPGTYTGVPLTGGSGSGAEATIVIDGASSISGSITQSGSGYTDNVYPFVQIFNEPTQTFVVTSIANPNAGNPGEPNYIYQIDGVTQPSLTLVSGNTYRFDMSDTSLDPSNGVDPGANHRMTFQMADGSGVDPEFEFYTKGSIGFPGAFQDLVIKPTAVTGTNVIRYDCANHPNMGPAGGNTTVNSGTFGNYGSLAYADLTVSGGQVTALTFSDNGSGYRAGDVLQVSNLDMGGAGTGFEYTVSSIVFTGTVTTVTITDSGSGYVTSDTLGINDSDVGGGGGSGFIFTITSNPGIIQAFTVNQRGTGYQLGDVLGLGQGVSNVSSYAPGQSGPYSTTLVSGNASFTISDTSALQVGMYASTDAGSTGSLDPVSVIVSIDSATQVTVDILPLAPGAANVTFTTPNPFLMTVADTTGMNIGDLVEKVSGTGVFAPGTTIANVDSATTLTLSTQPTSAGPIVFNANPPYGNPADDFAYTINALGTVDTFTVNNDGNGYAVGDLITVNPTDLTQPIVLPVTAKFVQQLTFIETIPTSWAGVGDLIKIRDGGITGGNETAPSVAQTVTGPIASSLTAGSAVVTLTSTTGISVGDVITEDASGNINIDPTVISVDSGTQITMSAPALQTSTPNLTFTSNEAGTFTNVAATGGSGSGATFDVLRESNGDVSAVTINTEGYGYVIGDILTIAGNLVGGTSPTHNISFEVTAIVENDALEVIEVYSSGGNITTLTVETNQGNPFDTAQIIVRSGQTTPAYTVDTASSLTARVYIDPDGNGAQLTPDLTLYVGSTYRFDLSDASVSALQFSLSEFPDGFNSPSRVENLSTTLDTATKVISVSSTTGIVVGMLLTGITGPGELDSDTRVASVDSATQITITQFPTVSGAAVVTFAGSQFTNGVTAGAGFLDLKVDSTTPSLYYYDNSLYPDIGGIDGNEAVITIDPVNPKVFGSGFELRVDTIQQTDVITSEVLDGTLTAVKVVSPLGEIDSVIGTSVSATTGTFSSSVTTLSVISTTDLTLDATSINLTNDLNVGLFSVTHSTGDLLTSGEVKTLNRLNVNDRLFILDNTIASDAASDLILTAPTGKLTKFSGFAGITIPSGNTGERPSGASDGTIRFNTQTNQYEGYSSSTSSWSSLGGVRDLDGNTYIVAEETVGANDNTLWFYNDNINTIRVTPNALEFVSVKTITSTNVSAPDYTNWVANAPVSVGDYLKYGLNLYEVTSAGTTGTSGSEPTHTSGAVLNGSAELTWYSLSVSPLVVDDVEV